MHYVASHLSLSEKVCYTAKIHWVDYIWVLIYNVYYILCMWFTYRNMINSTDNVYLLSLMFSIIVIADLYIYLSRYYFLEMIVTNKRVIFKTGIISVHTEELILKEVETTEIEQTFWGRILDFANIYIVGTGHSVVEFAKVKNPIKIKQIIDSQKGY